MVNQPVLQCWDCTRNISYPRCETGVQQDVCEKPSGIGQGLQAEYDTSQMNTDVLWYTIFIRVKNLSCALSPPPPA